MSSKIVLHVGMPKTGTTSFQMFLANNDMDNFFFPATRPNPNRRLLINEWCVHRFLSKALRSGNYSEVINRIREFVKISSDRSILLSDESIFTYWHKFGFEGMSSIAKDIEKLDLEMNIVLVKRNWLDFAISFYKEYQKHYVVGSSFKMPKMPFDEWIISRDALLLKDNLNRIEKEISSIKSINLKVFEYSQNINESIYSYLGVPTYTNSNKLSNVSFSNEATEILRLSNGFDYSTDAKELLVYLLLDYVDDSYDVKSLRRRILRGTNELGHFLNMLGYFSPQKSTVFKIVESEFQNQRKKLLHKHRDFTKRAF